jgi:hypothetical protein
MRDDIGWGHLRNARDVEINVTCRGQSGELVVMSRIEGGRMTTWFRNTRRNSSAVPGVCGM